MRPVNQFCTMKKLWFLAVLLSVCGCNRIDCPGYQNEYLNWSQYEQSDSIYFTDGTDTLKLRVNETYRSVAYKEHSWIIERSCYVEANASVSGDPDSVSITTSSFYTSEENFPIVYRYIISYNIGSAFFDFQALDNKVTLDYSIPVDLLNSFNNGFKDYPNVLKLDQDTTYPWGKPLIYEIYIAESVGIIQFKESGNQRIWSLMGK
jgi:hypothetical protein